MKSAKIVQGWRECNNDKQNGDGGVGGGGSVGSCLWDLGRGVNLGGESEIDLDCRGGIRLLCMHVLSVSLAFKVNPST